MAVSILSYFFTLSSFSWMMVEGINIIIIVVFVFQWNGNYHKQYLCIGYGDKKLLYIFQNQAMLQNSVHFFRPTNISTRSRSQGKTFFFFCELFFAPHNQDA